MPTRIFRSPDGVLPNPLALGYVLAGYPAGLWLLTASAWWMNSAGVVLTTHVLIAAAYFVHEFAHQSIFRNPETNNRWGTLMTWITGSCYATFGALRRKHMRHHLDRADVLTLDYKATLRRWPAWLQKLALLLKWAYVAVVELLMHGFVMAMPFRREPRRDERARVVAIVAVRAAAFGALGWYSPKALVLYAVSYMIMRHVLRFTDAYQHTYDAIALEGCKIADGKVRDRAYEQANTYSNLVSPGHPWLNLLLLNFPYHNAHHERITRVTADDYGEVGAGANKADGFLGAVGVSFLTAV